VVEPHDPPALSSPDYRRDCGVLRPAVLPPRRVHPTDAAEQLADHAGIRHQCHTLARVSVCDRARRTQRTATELPVALASGPAEALGALPHAGLPAFRMLPLHLSHPATIEGAAADLHQPVAAPYAPQSELLERHGDAPRTLQRTRIDGVERSCAAQTLAEAAQLVFTAITQGDVRAPDQARVATGVVRRVSVTYENQTRGHWAERQAAMIVMRPGYRSLSRSREFRPPLI